MKLCYSILWWFNMKCGQVSQLHSLQSMTTIVQLLPGLKHVLQRGLILSFAIAMMQHK